MAEENNAGVPAKKSSSKWILYTIAVIPVVAVLTSFLIVKVVNQRFTPLPEEDSAQTASHNSDNKKEGFLCQVGTILANPYGVDKRRIIKMGVLVEVPTESLMKKIEKLTPKLQHQAMMVLSSKDIESVSSTEGKIKLQAELREAFITELGLTTNDIRQVYFNDFVIQ